MTEFYIGNRGIGGNHPPLVIAEIGINHDGVFSRAERMLRDAAQAGAECVKLQCHVVDDEMIANDVVPGNAKESIWNMMRRCALSLEEERALLDLAQELGLLCLSTPFSRAAADRLQALGIPAFKIGSGECNNYPLVRHIAGFGKPVLLSTGMNDVETVRPSVELLRAAGVPFALLQCTSMYPTPYDKVQLGGLEELRQAFPDAVVGLSDHSLGHYTVLGAVALGAKIVEKHFTSDQSWPGADIDISLTPPELAELVKGAAAIHAALGGGKRILAEEAPTIAFAYASVVTIRPIAAGETLSSENLWVKRPGTGAFLARDYDSLLGRRAAVDIPADVQLRPEMLL